MVEKRDDPATSEQDGEGHEADQLGPPRVARRRDSAGFTSENTCVTALRAYRGLT